MGCANLLSLTTWEHGTNNRSVDHSSFFLHTPDSHDMWEGVGILILMKIEYVYCLVLDKSAGDQGAQVGDLVDLVEYVN